MDIHCAKCHEPWDSYGVHASKRNEGDMSPQEAARFLAGEGCPSCEFGTKCTECAGTGFEPDSLSHCPHCRGQFYTFVRLVQRDGGLWNRNPLYFDLLKRKLVVGQPIPDDFEIHEGYLPNVTVWTPAKRAIGHLLKIDCGAECRDGWYISVKTRCPVCTPTVRCPVCKGTGKFQTLPDDKTKLFQAASELLGSDTDGLVATLEDFS
jgi:hypothetical protein